ncbi:hypothetical protein AGMMS49936_03790 [Endomicrobiia bacterium]|nr:hypothetical protein AGMMS49936_03790 [Endomicrobiia bacterium]
MEVGFGVGSDSGLVGGEGMVSADGVGFGFGGVEGVDVDDFGDLMFRKMKLRVL